VVAVKAFNFLASSDTNPAGLLAEIIHDREFIWSGVQVWKVTTDPGTVGDEWALNNYDDSFWDVPTVVGKNDRSAPWYFKVYDIDDRASWIWSSSQTDNPVYFRFRLSGTPPNTRVGQLQGLSLTEVFQTYEDSFVHAQYNHDFNFLPIAQSYLNTPIQLFPIPRYKVPAVNLTIPMVITSLAGFNIDTTTSVLSRLRGAQLSLITLNLTADQTLWTRIVDESGELHFRLDAQGGLKGNSGGIS